MKTLLRTLLTLLGAFFSVHALLWMAAPEYAAAWLRMPLLEGAALSSQVGFAGAVFLALSVSIFVGLWRPHSDGLKFAALLSASVALFRAWAFAWHGAEPATIPTLVEAAIALLLWFSAPVLRR